MAEHTAKLAAKHSITMDKIVDELAKIGFSNIGNYLRPDARGMPAFKKLDEIDRDHLAALSEITVDTRQEFDGRGEDREQTATVDKVKFKLNNKVESLVTLARVLGFMPTSTRGSGADDDTPDDGRKVIIEVRQTAMPVPRRRTDYKDDD
jgi:phage terminase small subunit